MYSTEYRSVYSTVYSTEYSTVYSTVYSVQPYLLHQHLPELVHGSPGVQHSSYPLLAGLEVLHTVGGQEDQPALQHHQLPQVPGPATSQAVEALTDLQAVTHSEAQWTLHVGDDGHSPHTQAGAGLPSSHVCE